MLKPRLVQADGRVGTQAPLVPPVQATVLVTPVKPSDADKHCSMLPPVMSCPPVRAVTTLVPTHAPTPVVPDTKGPNAVAHKGTSTMRAAATSAFNCVQAVGRAVRHWLGSAVFRHAKTDEPCVLTPILTLRQVARAPVLKRPRAALQAVIGTASAKLLKPLSD